MIVADQNAGGSHVETETAHPLDAPARQYVLHVDVSERHAKLLDLVDALLKSTIGAPSSNVDRVTVIGAAVWRPPG